jgi:hypothetical protein
MLLPASVAAAIENLEFVAEHLPEVAMDNRFATLPLWGSGTPTPESGQFTMQGAYARTGSGGLTLGGPMSSIAIQRQFDERWSVRAFGFVDHLRFSGTRDQRPLEVLFAKTPLALPAGALFPDLHGTYRHTGAGVAFNLNDVGWLGERQWVFGALYQRVQLRNYRTAYRVLDGLSRDAAGFVDFSGTYAHFTPFAGLSLPRRVGTWSLASHALLAVPLPRRGIVGRIAGPGFDLSGDTAMAGNGKHFGDISATFGLDVTYEPWGLTIDAGSAVSQALLERAIHKGITRNWVISVAKRF